MTRDATCQDSSLNCVRALIKLQLALKENFYNMMPILNVNDTYYKDDLLSTVAFITLRYLI